MIKVNMREHPWHENLTVQRLLDEKTYTFKQLVVKVNGNFVPEDQYDQYVISDGDDVMVIHLMAGG
jgi:thiamine biosynthesis protein ThiS